MKKPVDQILKDIFEGPLEPMNHYVEEIIDNERDLTAEELLHVMRPETEKILLKYGVDQPPSQSHRATRCIDKVQELRCAEHLKHRTAKSRPLGLPKKWCELSQDLRALKNFLAVHRTVWILEGKPL